MSSSPPAKSMRRGKLIKVVMGGAGNVQHAGSSQPTRPGAVLLPRRDAGQASKPGVVFLPKAQGGAAAARSLPTRVAVPSVPAAVPALTLSPDQLLLCRHLVNAHMIAKGEGNEGIFAQETIHAIDSSLALCMGQLTEAPAVATVPKKVVVSGSRNGAFAAVSPRGVPSASNPSTQEDVEMDSGADAIGG